MSRIKDIKDKIIEKIGEIDGIEEVSGYIKTFKKFPFAVVKYNGLESEIITNGNGYQERMTFDGEIIYSYDEDEDAESFAIDFSELVLDKFYENSNLDNLCDLITIDKIDTSLMDEEQKLKLISVTFNVLYRIY